MRYRPWLAVSGLAMLVLGCADGTPDGPIVDQIDDAVEAIEDWYDAPQSYLEISATESVVSVLVAVDGVAYQAFWNDADGLSDPVEREPVDRPTFTAADIAFEDDILTRVRSELPDSRVLDFAITAAGPGQPVYDARLRSERGGVLLVLLGSDGSVLGVQGQ